MHGARCQTGGSTGYDVCAAQSRTESWREVLQSQAAASYAQRVYNKNEVKE